MLFSALIFGFLGSFHCIGMCGPIAFLLPVDRKHPVKRFFQLLSYHLGRLCTYSLIGFIFGLLGKSFYFFGIQQQISIIVGLSMMLSLFFPKILSKIHFSKKMSALIFKLKNALGKELKKKGNDTFFILGILNGFLPCGLVYMALLGALTTTNTFTGIFYMFFFGLGTIPLMTSVAYLGNFTNRLVQKKVQKIIPYFIFFIGALFVFRGLGLGIPYLSPLPIMDLSTSIKGCH